MARSKTAVRRPKGSTENQKEIKEGRIEKAEQTSTKDKAALKIAAKKTPSKEHNAQRLKEHNDRNKRPISKKKKLESKAARESLASGELASEDQVRRKDRDVRTLYIRFKDTQKLPENQEAVKNLHEDIQVVRLPRQATKRVKFAYVEFSSETKCAEAKLSIEKNDGLYVDYVGTKSKGGGKPKHERGGKGKNVKQINPTRLFITGLIEGMTEDKLKQLFPKCCKANIPKGSIRKGTMYGFVQFTNPADAKSAFDAAKKLTVQAKEGKEAQRITVLYATATKHPSSSKTKENTGDNPPKDKENDSNNKLDAKDEVKDEDDQLEKDEESDDEEKEMENDEESDAEESENKNKESVNDADSDDDQDMENDAESDEADSKKDESEAEIDESGDSDE